MNLTLPSKVSLHCDFVSPFRIPSFPLWAGPILADPIRTLLDADPLVSCLPPQTAVHRGTRRLSRAPQSVRTTSRGDVQLRLPSTHRMRATYQQNPDTTARRFSNPTAPKPSSGL